MEGESRGAAPAGLQDHILAISLWTSDLGALQMTPRDILSHLKSMAPLPLQHRALQTI